MKRVTGLSIQQLETREQVMEGLARNGIRAAFRAVSLGELVTAAATPSISTTAASQGVATLAPVELSVAPDTWSAYVDAVLYPFLLETYTAAAQKTWSYVGDTLQVATTPVDPLTAEDYLRAAVNRLKNVGNLIWNSIRDTLAEGYAAGETTHQLAARVRSVAKDVGEKRALVIAKTEVISAANAASLAQVNLGGFTDAECSKRWLATDDERTRPEHRLADGQTVGLSQAFFVGGEYLQHPGDPTGRADNVIQCRCTVEFVFDDDAEPDPLVAADAPDLNWNAWNKANPGHNPKDSSGRWAGGKAGAEVKLLATHFFKKWDDGDVVAHKTAIGGKEQRRIVWNATTKKFDVQKRTFTDTGPTTWSTVASHTKTEAAKIYPKNAGWKPSSDVTKKPGPTLKGLASTALTTPTAPATPTTAPAANLPPAAVGKPLHVNTNVIYKQTYADGATVAVRVEPGVGHERIIWRASTKKFVLQKSDDGGQTWQNFAGYGKGEAYKKFSKETGWLAPDATLSGGTTPHVIKVTEMTEVKPAGPPTLAGIGFDPSMANQPISFDIWFKDNLEGKKDTWDQLSYNDQKMIEAAAFGASMFGFEKGSKQISLWHDQDHAVKSISTSTTPTIPFTPKSPVTVTVDPNDVSGPHFMSPAFNGDGKQVAWVKYYGDGSGAVVYSLDSPDFGNETKNGIWVDIVDFEDGDSLEEAIQKHVDSGKLKPTAINTAKTKTIPPPPPPPSPTPAVPAPHGYGAHLAAHASVKFVGDIGQPKVSQKSFKETDVAGMKKIQSDMLAKAGKKWTPAETSAVSLYTTSTGYQSMNGVLRNDETRLKLFSDAQLTSAAKSAADLQNAMTPLTENLTLHRGTGAQQFGFKTIKVSTDKLKKLEGTTITDRGFVSTSVVPPAAISYDYAKKPIKVIVQAPAGTPGVYVSSATPGYSHENEFIIGAGSSYHVTEVRAATADDKVKYGSHTEQVVTLTVVPATKQGPKDVTGASTPAKNAAVTTTAPVSPSVAPPKPSPALAGKGGQPIKLNTNTIYKQSYGDGAVVAVTNKLDADGFKYRLVWQESQKKFLLQVETVPGEWLTATNQPQYKFGKGEAYKKFSGDTHWVTPDPGDTALGTSGFSPKVSTTVAGPYDHFLPGLKVGDYVKTHDGHVGEFTGEALGYAEVKVSGGTMYDYKPGQLLGIVAKSAAPTTAPTSPTPAKKTAPVKFDAAQLQAMHGTPPTLSDVQKKYFWSDFKHVGGTVTINSPVANIFKKLHKAVDEHNKKYPGEQLNLLQGLKLIDEKASSYSTSGTNENLYEKKIIDWLQTPSGKSTATKVVHPSPTTPKSTSTSGTTSTATSGTLQDLLSKIKDPTTIGTAHTKVTTFKVLTDGEAKKMQNEIYAAAPLTSAQKSGLHIYTTGAYTDINGVLRGKYTMDNNSTQLSAKRAKNAQDGMRPLTQDVKVFRRTGAAQFPGLTDYSNFNDIKKFDGKVFQDKGFLSTSIVQGTWSGNVELEIEVPAGTPASYVGGYGNISAHPGEHEMILAAGLRYRVLKVEPWGSSGARVKLRVEP